MKFFRRIKVETLQNRTDLQLTCTTLDQAEGYPKTEMCCICVASTSHSNSIGFAFHKSPSQISAQKAPRSVIETQLHMLHLHCKLFQSMEVQMSIFRVCQFVFRNRYLAGWTPHQQVLQRTTASELATLKASRMRHRVKATLLYPGKQLRFKMVQDGSRETSSAQWCSLQNYASGTRIRKTLR